MTCSTSCVLVSDLFVSKKSIDLSIDGVSFIKNDDKFVDYLARCWVLKLRAHTSELAKFLGLSILGRLGESYRWMTFKSNRRISQLISGNSHLSCWTQYQFVGSVRHSLFPGARADFSDPAARWQRGRKLPILYFRVKSACCAIHIGVVAFTHSCYQILLGAFPLSGC